MLRRSFFSSPILSNNTSGRCAVFSSTKFAAVTTSATSVSMMRTNSIFARNQSSLLARFGSFSTISNHSRLYQSKRFNSTEQQKTTEQQQQQNTSNNNSEQQKQEGNTEQQNQQQKTNTTEEPKGPGGIRGHIEGIKTDIKQFPDIYNWQNMLSLAFFTIFCLSSTGTQVEANWWLEHWAIDWDSYKRPWSILFHSLHMNNFLSMIFAILVLHNSLHPLVHGLAGGSAALMQYCGLVSLLSGLMMWGFNYFYYASGEGAVDVATGKPVRGEKQFGPWDIAAAVLLMQYLRLGIAPHRFLLSFNGWVKYACCVGAVCIVYYDPQPVLCGTLLGYGFCRFAPAFRPIAAKV